MTRRSIILAILAAILIIQFHGSARADYFLADLRDGIKQRFEGNRVLSEVSYTGEHLYAPALLQRFYKTNDYRPAWIDTTGISPQVDALIRTIYEAYREGLTPDEYHIAAIQGLIELIRDSENGIKETGPYVDLDLLLSDAFFIYASHLISGRVNPETIHATWEAKNENTDLDKLLENALDSESIRPVLKKLSPPHRGYLMLRYALIHYRSIARRGGWEPIPPGPMMRRGDRGVRIKLLRQHLIMTEDLKREDGADPDIFDRALKRAVMRYQRRHGLSADGVVGPETLEWLNIPAEELVETITLNMERWRWLPRTLGETHILVNIADYSLDVVHNEKSELNMRVIVGTNYRKTPVFSSSVTHMIINPYWYLPPVITEEDILPAVKKDPGYLAERKIRLLKSWRNGAPEIDPATINWKKVNVEQFPYRFRQDPGALNPLGAIKFFFPNDFDVYLHDTPARKLFERKNRGFSSGCIRAEKPVDLAAYLLKDEDSWNWDEIEEAIASGERHIFDLPVRVPIHLLYWTAWVDENVLIHFRNDIYERDALLKEALREKPTISVK
jgi:murein L,D-transpeptidase YcbB/YkuD